MVWDSETDTSSLFLMFARQSPIYSTRQVLICYASWNGCILCFEWTHITVYFRRGSSLLCSTRQMSICYGTNIFIMTRRADAYFLRPWNEPLFIMLRETDAYFSRPVRQMITSYIPRSKCLFLYSAKQVPTSYTFWDECLFIMLHKTDSYLLCSVRRIFIMSTRWTYVPRPTSTHPFPLVKEKLVSFTCIHSI